MIVNVTALRAGDRLVGATGDFRNAAAVQPEGVVRDIRQVPSRVWIDFTDGRSFPIHPSHDVVVIRKPIR